MSNGKHLSPASNSRLVAVAAAAMGCCSSDDGLSDQSKTQQSERDTQEGRKV